MQTSLSSPQKFERSKVKFESEPALFVSSTLTQHVKIPFHRGLFAFIILAVVLLLAYNDNWWQLECRRRQNGMIRSRSELGSVRVRFSTS